MARYCIAYDSMKQFLEIKGKESLSDLVSSFSSVVLFIYSPIIVKVNITHLVFLSVREQEISASSAELFRGDPKLYLSIKLLIHCLALTDLLLRVSFLFDFTSELPYSYKF